jgi:hypothetical protein
MVDPEVILSLLTVLQDAPKYLRVGKVEGLPPGARALDVRHDWQAKMLAVLVEHDSFAPVADGEDIPKLGVREVAVVWLRREDGEADPPCYVVPAG